MKKLIILLIFTQLSFSQTIDYDNIEFRPFLLSGKAIEKELKKSIVIPDEISEIFRMINIEFIVSKDGEVSTLKTNTNNKVFDRELFLIIKKFGLWVSPEHSGKKVNCKISINVKISN